MHVDTTFQLLDPSISIDAIASQGIELFRQGELGRMILDPPRRAERPLTTAEVALTLVEAGGHSDSGATDRNS